MSLNRILSEIYINEMVKGFREEALRPFIERMSFHLHPIKRIRTIKGRCITRRPFYFS